MQAHLRRLYEGLAALDIVLDVPPTTLATLLRRTLDVNGMRAAPAARVRVAVSRGLKRSSSHHPHATIGAPTIMFLPEWVDPTPPSREQVRAAAAAALDVRPSRMRGMRAGRARGDCARAQQRLQPPGAHGGHAGQPDGGGCKPRGWRHG
jgi:branched-chain amino acid aminotransferase